MDSQHHSSKPQEVPSNGRDKEYVGQLGKVAEKIATEFEQMQETKPGRVLYLDLDGTVRYSSAPHGFVNGPEDVMIFPEAKKLIRRYRNMGWKIVAVSNQGGIAMGLVTMEKVCAALMETNMQVGGHFDLMYMCRHHPDAKDPLMAQCLCRKPKYGMIVQAQDELARRFGGMYPPSMALMVGDREEDRLCAEGAGIAFKTAEEWRKEATQETTYSLP